MATTVEFSKAQRVRLERLAKERGVPVGDIVSEAVDQYLMNEAVSSKPGLVENPLADLIGAVDDAAAPTDGSVSFKAAIYGS